MADAPTIPGSYIGEHRNGYFWNGTSWDQAETAGGATAEELFRRQATASTPAPSTPFGGTIINQQNATPAPAAASAPTPTAAKRASILATIMRVESGGKNIPQSPETRDINNNYGKGGGDPAQGFYQITGGTWREHGGDATGNKSAIDAPYPVQLQIAQNIPVQRWGPATQQALKSAGYEPQPGETLGQMLARYNEDPTATRPEDVGGSSAGGTTAVAAAPAAPYAPPAGLLAGSSDPAALLAAQQAAAKAKEEENAYGALTKQGMGLLGQAETPAAPIRAAQVQVHRPQVQPTAMPDFLEILAQQRLKQRGIV